MLDPHMSLGIAQVVFYVPIVPLAFMLMKRNGKVRPRMAWYPFIPFSICKSRPRPTPGRIEAR